jgi:Arc-like DNA binding dprotein
MAYAVIPFDGTKCMAKRKKTDIVQFKLRIREALRRRLEANARFQERSLNSEIAHRLENSFEQEKNALILELLLARGAGLELIRAVASVLSHAGQDWNTPPKSHAVSEAIRKYIAVLSGELEPIENSFPNHNEQGSADQLVYPHVLVGRWHAYSDEYWARPPATSISKPAGNTS